MSRWLHDKSNNLSFAPSKHLEQCGDQLSLISLCSALNGKPRDLAFFMQIMKTNQTGQKPRLIKSLLHVKPKSVDMSYNK